MNFFIILIVFLFTYLFSPVIWDGIATEAEELRYFDSNLNWKIDSVEFKFNKKISIDNFNSDKLKVYSSSGWLSNYFVEDWINWTVSVVWDWNILKIDFTEYDKIWTDLLVTDWADSHLRFKKYTWWWIRDLEWNEAKVWYWSFDSTNSSYWVFSWCYWDNCVWIEIPGKITWFENNNLKIPVVVNNFDNIWWFELSLSYDKNQLSCTWFDSNVLWWFWSSSFSVDDDLWVLNFIWDYWTDSALNLTDGAKLLDFKCVVVWTIWNLSDLTLSINELGDYNWSKLGFTIENIQKFFIQENLEISWLVKNLDNSVFNWAKLILKNWSSSFSSIFEKVSSSVWFSFDLLIKNNDYEISIDEDLNYTDNLVDVWDIIKIQRFIVWEDANFTWYNCAASDVNQDWNVSVLDIIKMRKYLANHDDLPSWNLKYYSNEFWCENLSARSEKFSISDLDNSLSNFVFTKVRMWNIE